MHGGALAVQPRGHLLDYNWQRDRQADEKHRIGLRAASLIADDQTVILDGGSTVASVAEHLVEPLPAGHHQLPRHRPAVPTTRATST